MGNAAGTLVLRINFSNGEESTSKSINDTAVESPVFVAGRTIQGHVCVDFGQIEKIFPGQAIAFQIDVALCGKERSKIVTGATARKAERTLMVEQKTLRKIQTEEVYTPRWHEFAFELEIPSQMPGSLRCEEKSRQQRISYGELQYKIVASLNGPSKQQQQRMLSRRRLFTSPPSIERKIAIHAAPVPIIVVPYMMQPISREIRTFGVKRNGHILFGASVADTHVGPDETLEVCVACRNYATADIEHVYFRLIETISWKVDETNQTKIVERVLVDQVASMLIPAPKDLWYRNNILGDIGHEEESFVSLYHELKSRRNPYKVKVPSSNEINDDYAGPLVRCTHHLEIRIKTENHVDDPRVRVPLQLKQYASFKKSPNQLTSRVLSALPHVNDATSTPNHATYLADRPKNDPVRSQIDSLLEENWRSSLSDCSKAGASSVTNSHQGSGNVALKSMALDDIQLQPKGDDDNTSTRVRPSTFRAGGRVKEVSVDEDLSSSGIPRDSMSTIASDVSSIPSFQALLDEMLVSVDDFDIVCAKLENQEWIQIFYQLTPEEFGTMIAHVNLDHDQPKVATVVAGQISLESSSFTVEHIKSALRNAADWIRTCLVQQLLPFCSDLAEAHDHLVKELTEWELVVLASDIEAALNRRQT